MRRCEEEVFLRKTLNKVRVQEKEGEVFWTERVVVPRIVPTVRACC